jgi:hypothetical protein
MLGAGNRASFVSPQSSGPRPFSTGSAPTARSAPIARRGSYPLAASLPVLPYTRADWKRTISEIKRQYINKKYRTCSARCNEILDSIAETSQIEPVYLIYLHFYSAASTESCARLLPITSSFRTSLLQQARAHFDQAASLIAAAEDSILRKRRSGSTTSSPSCHSPSGSISSRAWTPETGMSSPTNSVYSFEDLSAKTHSPPKRVKKVSFSLPQETFRIPEPIVRPDSPTLGFDDEYFHCGVARQELPDLPKPKFQEVELPLQDAPVYERLIADDDAFVVARSVGRYREHLSGLRAQLANHSANVDELLSVKGGQTALADTFKYRTSIGDDLRALDRQARIERLRESGWQRKRFDARRYVELCDAVLSELA